MYAVVETGGKQYRVAVGDKLKVEKLDAEAGSTIELDRVLMTSNDGEVTVGSPTLKGTAVAATVLEQGRGDKIKVYKFKRRKKYRRTQGHRQSYTELEITSIGGASAAAKSEPAQAKPAKPQKTESAEAPVAEKADSAATAKASSGKLTDLTGVGPAFAKKLNEADVTTLEQIAALDDAGVAALEEKLGVSGKFEKAGWVAEAQSLLA